MKPDRENIKHDSFYMHCTFFWILWRNLDQVCTVGKLKIAHIYQSKVRESVLNSLGGDAQGV